MTIIDLNEEQVEDIEERLEDFDESYITYKMNGEIHIGIEDDGKLVAGLNAYITNFKILLSFCDLWFFCCRFREYLSLNFKLFTLSIHPIFCFIHNVFPYNFFKFKSN